MIVERHALLGVTFAAAVFAAVVCLTGPSLAETAASDSQCNYAELSPCPQPIDKFLPDVAKMLTWDETSRIIGQRNDYRNYPGTVYEAGASHFPLPEAAAEKQLNPWEISYTRDGKTVSLKQYQQDQKVQGLLVIKNGEIVYQHYAGGNTPTTLWTSNSVGKSFVSTLVGIAIKEGKIGSLDDEVTKYNPTLKGTGWDGVTLKNLINMDSGIDWTENYTDPNSSFSKLVACQAQVKVAYKCAQDLIYPMTRKNPPGKVFSYTSGGAWLLGDVLETAVGMPIGAYLEKKIWKPFGMANDGVWHAYEVGKHDVGAHGMNATLKDWGRFGLFIAGGGILPDGTSLLPDNWLKDSASWSKAEGSVSASYPEGIYSHEWWNMQIPADAKNVNPTPDQFPKGTLWAVGIYGQVIAISAEQKLVYVQWSTWPEAEPNFSDKPENLALMFTAIANKLKK